MWWCSNLPEPGVRNYFEVSGTQKFAPPSSVILVQFVPLAKSRAAPALLANENLLIPAAMA